ncbi:MAG: CheB methylesterase domain-containing protein [Defluviitaleaceae bacterium]|nr:CheB methylesterase domain-containing protein [Defluviitaleaceae bacterium]
MNLFTITVARGCIVIASKMIAIGASTGGFDALEAILASLPSWSPPILIAMHLQPGISRAYAARLNGLSHFASKEAESGDKLQKGHVFVAPGGMHMRVISRLGALELECYSGERVHHVAPSADVLFDSIVKETPGSAIGVLLTGIGQDGAQGLLNMRRTGSTTIGQDKDSCLVYGMPKVAKDIGAVQFELPLNQIAAKITELISP